MSEWIKASERLPEKSGRYLAYSPNHDFVCICFYNSELHQLKSNITHWMPIPEKPNE